MDKAAAGMLVLLLLVVAAVAGGGRRLEEARRRSATTVTLNRRAPLLESFLCSLLTCVAGYSGVAHENNLYIKKNVITVYLYCVFVHAR